MNIERQILETQNQVSQYYTMLRICSKFLNYKNERQKNVISSYLLALDSNDNKHIDRTYKKLINELSSIKDAKVSYSSISNAFENNNIHLSDNKISSIASSPLNYVKEYANLLYNTRIKLENLKRNIGKSNTQEKSISNKTSSFEESKKDSDYSSIDTYSESVLSSSNERKVEEAKIIMDKYMNSKNNSSISYDELETLKKVYPEIADYGGLSTSSVENLIKIKQIMNRLTDYDAKSNINVMVNDMMKLGIYTVDVMQDYLYNDRKINKKFSSEYSVNALLSNYENSYNKFMKIYNKLDDSSKIINTIIICLIEI